MNDSEKMRLILVLSTNTRILKELLLRIRAIVPYKGIYPTAIDFNKIREEEDTLKFKILRNKERIQEYYTSLSGYKKDYFIINYISQNEIETGYVPVNHEETQYLLLSNGTFVTTPTPNRED